MADVARVGKIIRVDESVDLVIGFVALGSVDAREDKILVEKDATILVVGSPLPGTLRVCCNDLSSAIQYN